MNIATWRLRRGFSQLRLAHEAGVSRFRISLAERGYAKLDLEELHRIAKILGPPPPRQKAFPMRSRK